MSASKAFVHQAELDLTDAVALGAPGAAVTISLCGHWSHDGVCRWPHNNEIDATRAPAVLRTVFIALPAEEREVRSRIDAALTARASWTLRSSGPRPLANLEEALAHRLSALASPPLS